MNETKYWLGLTLVQHIGNTRIAQLLAHFGEPSRVWRASETDLQRAGLDNQALQSLSSARKELDLEHEYERVLQVGASLVTINDDNYPENLRKIGDPPSLLYVRGTLLPTDTRALAIVGTRRASRYGKDAAQRMAYWLAQNSVTIVSGLAQGVDTAAHQGALEAEGRTIAVLGCGIDRIYPTENQALAEEIARNGAIVSEVPIGTPPSGKNFPRRNRIISGLSLGVMIAEAPERSGALITADAAIEQGREVFAIPANIFNPIGTGGNKLIQDGAKLIMRAADVLDELDIAYTQYETRTMTEAVVPDNDIESIVLGLLEADPVHVDDLIRQTGLATAQVTATLTILELKGLAQSAGHMQYCRAR